MAATEPVTPSSTLAMSRLLMVSFKHVEQRARQFGTRYLVVPLLVAQERPFGGTIERVGDHPIGGRIPARTLGDGEQFVFAHADLQLELDEQAVEFPFATNFVDELRRAHQTQPKFGFVALDLGGGSIEPLVAVSGKDAGN